MKVSYLNDEDLVFLQHCRGVGLGGPVGAAVNGVRAVSGSAYRVTIPAVLRIACLRRLIARAALRRAG